MSQALGIKVKRVFSWVWIISAVVAAVAGVLMATSTSVYINMPEIAFKGIIVALFGGLESIGGALLGGLLLGFFEGLTAGYAEPILGGGARDMSAFALLLFILLVRPYGLFGYERIERV